MSEFRNIFNFTKEEKELIDSGDKYTEIVLKNRYLVALKNDPNKDGLKYTRGLVDMWSKWIDSKEYKHEDREYYEGAIQFEAQSEWGSDGDVTLSYRYKFATLTHPKKSPVII